MTEQHPITPPPELVEQWKDEWENSTTNGPNRLQYIASQAARWGADQELEACCAIAISDPVCGTKHQRNMLVRHIKEQRRPKPPSLKEKALRAYWRFQNNEHTNADEMMRDFRMIEKALEALTDD